MAHELIALPYPYDALEPHIDARTMEIHHTKHHQTYVTNLNNALHNQAALAAKPLERLLREIEQVPQDIRQAVINHGGGTANHNLFWQIMGKGNGGQPKGALADDLTRTFGSFEAFKEQFTKAATTRFGSGWAWLTLDPSHKLAVSSTGNQDSPYMQGHTPILGLDVWEHAYYLNYQNRRPDYITAWWNVVNWDSVADLYASARK
ncbi:MAG: superoxide dismutase [Phycisphaerales bacterium]|nr:superoxide dismutase [Phycisphaerales bacterium]